ncbi:MAG: glutamate synthase-related protein, partial [Mariprofundales bacterium]
RIFRDHISLPTIPALARARRHLDQLGRSDVTLIITGGLRMPEDFIKAMALGADGVAVANSALPRRKPSYAPSWMSKSAHNV